MKSKKERIIYYFCILISFLLFVGIFAPWLTYDHHTYTIYGFYAAVKASGGMAAFSQGNAAIYPAYLFLILPFVAGILSAVKTCLLVIKGRKTALSYAIYALEWVHMGGFFAFRNYLPTIFAILSMILVFVEFMLNKYLDDYKEITKKSRELKEREREEKADRKKRLSFPGRYSNYFYLLMFRNARYHKNEYLLLLASGSFSVTFLFTILAIESMLKDVHSSEVFLLGEGIQSILSEAVMAAVIINMIMMGFSFAYYTKNKMEQEHTMMILGMRKKVLNLIWVVEYGVCLLVSLVSGYVFGNIIAAIFRQIVRKNLTPDALLKIEPRVYLWTILVFSAVTFVSVIVNYEIYLWGKNAGAAAAKKEKIPQTKKVLPGIVVGAVLAVFGVYCYGQRKNAESLTYVCLFLAGIVLLLTCLLAVWTKKRERGNAHFKNIIGRTPFYFHFSKTSQTLSILLVIHFMILTVCTMQFAGVAAAPKAEALYPYDFACMAYEEDETLFAEISKECTKVQRYPMVRVTSVEGDAYGWTDAANNSFMGILWPQGQHVGISETTYRKLKGDGTKLNLGEEAIHIVYQQDPSFKAHPLDWYLSRKHPYLRIGQPLRSYSFMERETLYPPREVQSEEISVLTGMFQRGMQEDLVVFSDEYFEELSRGKEGTVEGPVTYYLLNVKDGAYESVKGKLQTFEKKHLSDSSWDRSIRPYYDSRQMIKNTESERMLKIVVSLFELLMLAACSILIFSLKIVSEFREIKERYQLLFKIGMREQERKEQVRNEIRPFFMISLIAAGIFSGLFTILMFVLRMYGKIQIVAYLKFAVVVWGVYLLIQIIYYQCLKFPLYRLVQGNSQERRK